MSRSSNEDPLKAFRFRIVIDGFARAGFSEASGLERNTEEVKYREGGGNETPEKSAGLTEFSDIVLKRGQIIGSQRGGDDDFINWCQDVHDVASQGTAENYRRDFDIEQYNSQNVRVRTWRITNAWPKRFKPFSDLKGDANENSIEEMTLGHEGFTPAQ